MHAAFASVVTGARAGLAYRAAHDACKTDEARAALKYNVRLACIAGLLAKQNAAKALTVAQLACSDALLLQASKIETMSVKQRKAVNHFQTVKSANTAFWRIEAAAGLKALPSKDASAKDAKAPKSAKAKTADAPSKTVTVAQINNALQGVRAKTRGDVEQHILALCVDAEHFPRANAKVWPMGARGEAMRVAMENFAKAIRALPEE